MNEYKKSRDIPNDVTVTSQSGLFCAILNTFAENDPFSCGFQLSIKQGRGQIVYYVSVYTHYNYIIYKNINIVHDLALY